jgi:guanosine-3',5'-bis(diphosphate) 3'-pyrophosphohydrolase
MDLVLRAAEFAAEAHRDQRRKNVLAAPYINHPIGVARLLACSGILDPYVLAAALLHDVVEDTKVTLDEVRAEFGTEVGSIVGEVTDDRSLSKAERKRRQIESGPQKSYGAKLVKAADKLHNCTDLFLEPPADWPAVRQRQYFAHAHAVLVGMGYGTTGIHPALDSQLDTLFVTATVETAHCTVRMLPTNADERLALVRDFLAEGHSAVVPSE